MTAAQLQDQGVIVYKRAC